MIGTGLYQVNDGIDLVLSNLCRGLYHSPPTQIKESPFLNKPLKMLMKEDAEE